MRGIRGFLSGSVLAMAGRRSPWGKGPEGSDVPSGSTGDAPEPGEPPVPDGPPPPPPSSGPRNPWLPPSSSDEPPRRSASIEDIFRSRPGGSGGNGSFGGGGGPRFPRRADGKSWLPLIALGLGGLWLFATASHMLGPKEQGVVTTFGKYSRTIGPGVSLTLPWPFQAVEVRDVTSIKLNNIPDGDSENLILTSDQSLVDLSYLIRWRIADLKLYTFQLENPEQTVTETAEAAMRASVAEVPLNGVMGAQRGVVADNVQRRMQGVLDAYRSGIQVMGVEIKKADPPDRVNDAFQKVSAAQQDAERDLSNAQAWAQQLIARAQGEAAAFDKVYEQYRLAPEVTRQRMYYETMERVLSSNDKVIVEGSGVTSYLPLPEVRRRPATEPAPEASGGR